MGLTNESCSFFWSSLKRTGIQMLWIERQTSHGKRKTAKRNSCCCCWRLMRLYLDHEDYGNACFFVCCCFDFYSLLPNCFDCCFDCFCCVFISPGVGWRVPILIWPCFVRFLSGSCSILGCWISGIFRLCIPRRASCQ
jgi:hypothetical protein